MGMRGVNITVPYIKNKIFVNLHEATTSKINEDQPIYSKIKEDSIQEEAVLY